MALDPIFAKILQPYNLEPLIYPDAGAGQPAAPGYFGSAAYVRDEIAGLEGDIETWQETIDKNTVEVPKMQLETLQARLDVALANLKIYELRAKLVEKGAVLLLLMMICIPTLCQLPDAPKPQRLERIDWALLAADASARTLDTISTRQMLGCRCNHELVLPGFIANHTAALAAFETGMVAVNYEAVRYLRGRHHPRVARALLIGDALSVGTWAIHNFYLKSQPKDMVRIKLTAIQGGAL